MSRERPGTVPSALPDAARGRKPETPNQLRARTEIARLKALQGPGLMGALGAFFATHGGGGLTLPDFRFIRRGYEANIIEDLQLFYARRPRPWRPANRAPKPNRKTVPRGMGRRAIYCLQELNRFQARYISDPVVSVVLGTRR